MGVMAVVLALLVSAGQALAMPLDGGGRLGERLSAPTVCVPPGLPPYTSWTAVEAKVAIYQGVDNRPIVGVKALYDGLGNAIVVVWIGGVMASVDPAPDDPAVLVWIDPGMATPQGLMRLDPKPSCQWQRAAPRPPANPLEENKT